MNRVYVSVYKTEDKAVSAVNKLHDQGFRGDQIYVLTYNLDKFGTLYDATMELTPLPMRNAKANQDEDVPEGVKKAVESEASELPDPVVPVAPGGAFIHTPAAPAAGYIPIAAWGDLDVKDDFSSYQRDYENGDILVVLKTDEEQQYHPNMPVKQ